MVTSQNGVQFAVFICLLWCSLSTAKSVLAIRRSKSYEIPEHLEAFPDDLTSDMNVDLLNGDIAEEDTRSEGPYRPPSSKRSPHGRDEEIVDDSIFNYDDERWLPQPQRRSPSFQQDFLEPETIPFKTPSQEEFGWKLDEPTNVLQPQRHSNYGTDFTDLQSIVRGISVPYQQLLRPPSDSSEGGKDEGERKEVYSGHGKRTQKFHYKTGHPPHPPKGLASRKRFIVQLPPIKRWAWTTNGYYRPRPQMDRRAAQSKHYGCLKRCIGIGKLHPIQCHTLC